MDLRVLGPVEMIHDGRNIVPTAPKPRQVISLLLLRRNTVVRTEELIDELWEGDGGPPTSAMTTLQTYVYKLRKILVAHEAGNVLRTRPGGYLLAVPNSALDLCRFEQAACEGQALLESDHPAQASEKLAGALALWRGQALADVVQGALLSSYATRLEELRSRALELRIEADLRLGQHRELISELKALVLTKPLHEHLHASLMIALHRSGRRHEALETYRTLRRNMIDELGLEPGAELQEVHQALLSDSALHRTPGPSAFDPVDRERTTLPPVPAPAASDEPLPQATSPVPLVAPEHIPSQIPADTPDFCGRQGAIEELTSRLAPPETGTQRTATPIVTISGLPGVGKTALAVHLAHRIRARFDGGQLYARLEGSSTAPRDPADVLDGFLRALGIAPRRIPEGLEERGAALRSATAGRRVLLVLDDVASWADARALLPGDAGCAVIITGRRRFHGPAGSAGVDLDPMGRADSVRLLTRLVGPDRAQREQQAIDRLAALSDGLPLALRCLGGRLATLPELSVAELVDQLADAEAPLELMRIGDLDVRSGFDTGYAGLNRLQQGVFRLLAMLPAEGFTTEAASELLGWEPSDVARVLDRLADEHLIKAVRQADGHLGYAFPPLVLGYARERLMSALAGGQRAPWTGDGPTAGEHHPWSGNQLTMA
ncbi:SARP family transcriptional regulator [Streptomyces nigrescens]|uniref:SARP family transcriptional regulator n=2 Tax=Streptomyces nigrescens TaxID=1920 RepID=A0ABN6QYX1_STRNI|nr:SARP family transcriptional regulator [Streptomyces nigrescens]